MCSGQDRTVEEAHALCTGIPLVQDGAVGNPETAGFMNRIKENIDLIGTRIATKCKKHNSGQMDREKSLKFFILCFLFFETESKRA